MYVHNRALRAASKEFINGVHQQGMTPTAGTFPGAILATREYSTRFLASRGFINGVHQRGMRLMAHSFPGGTYVAFADRVTIKMELSSIGSLGILVGFC
jgi:hypothetical protein